MPQFSADDRRTLLDYFVNRYTLEQMTTLLFVDGINRNTFSANATLPGLCTEVLQYCIGNGQLACLLRDALRDKPDPGVQAIYARCPSCEPGVKVEVTIHDANLNGLASALKAFMEAHGLKASEVSLVGAGAGSLLMLLSVPSHVADKIINYPVTELAGGQYHVASVRLFRMLTPAQQAWWMQVAQTTPRAIITQFSDGTVNVQLQGAPQATTGGLRTTATGAAQAGFTIGRVLLIFVIVVAAGVAAGVVVAPSLVLHNQCGQPLPLPITLPFVGDQIAEGDSSFKVLPGDYSIIVVPANNKQNISITGPLIGTVIIPLDPGQTFSVSVDGGPPLQIGSRTPTVVNIGPNSRVDVTLCGP
jgi:hypothetical protein